jgi:conjugal transfer pilus assembly protein TraE
MDIKKFLSTWKGTLWENKLQRYLIAALVASNIVLGLAAFGRSEVVVLTPPEITRALKVARDQGDQSYSETWGLALAQLLGNVTPGNADFVKRSIAPVLAPSIYQDTMNALFQQVEQIKLDRVSTRLDPREVIYEPKTGKVFVTGYSVAAGPAGKEERDTRTYEFIIRVHNYQPLVTYIDTYRGAPHTLENNERAGTQAAREPRQPDGSAEADAGNTKEKR